MPAMFSRIVASNRSLLVAALRNGKVIQPTSVACFHSNPKDVNRTQALIDHWTECNKKYFGPDRDLKNYPAVENELYTPPITLSFIPRAWIDALYEKTGVSGPYLTMGGLLTFLLSKEIWVMDHYFFEFLGFWGAVALIINRWGKPIAEWHRKDIMEEPDDHFHHPKALTHRIFSEAVGKVDTEIEHEARHKYIFEVQRENLDLQLEARYRERVNQVYSAVKKRLDYQVELVTTKKRLEQQHMVNWIVDSVVKGITPKQEKDAITSCIDNLRSLAKGQPSTAV